MNKVLTLIAILFSMNVMAFEYPQSVNCEPYLKGVVICGKGQFPRELPVVNAAGKTVMATAHIAVHCNTGGFCSNNDTNEFLFEIEAPQQDRFFVIPRFYQLAPNGKGDFVAVHPDVIETLNQVNSKIVAGNGLEQYDFDGQKVAVDHEFIESDTNPAWNGPGMFEASCNNNGACTVGFDKKQVSWKELPKYIPVQKSGECEKYLCVDGGFVVGLNPELYDKFRF